MFLPNWETLVCDRGRWAVYHFAGSRKVRPQFRLRWIEESQRRAGKFELFPDTTLNELHQFSEVSLSRFLLYLCGQPLHPVHFSMRCFLQSPPEYSLQRLDENHQHE